MEITSIFQCLGLTTDQEKEEKKVGETRVPRKATGTGTPPQRLQHEKQQALGLNVSQFL